MLSIESIFSSGFLGQLRSFAHMSASHDGVDPSGDGMHQPDIQGNIAQDVSTAPDIDGAPGQTVDKTDPDAPVSVAIADEAGSELKKKTRRALPAKIPEEGSIYHSLMIHANESLFVLPVMWTDRHTELLGVRFLERPPILTPVPANVPGRWIEPSDLARSITRELHVLSRVEKKQPASARLLRKTNAIKHILNSFFPPLPRPRANLDLDLFFGNKVYRHAVRAHCIWKTVNGVNSHYGAGLTKYPNLYWGDDHTVDYAPHQPLLAYLSRSQMKVVREHLFKVVRGPGGAPNEPVKRLLKLRSKMLMPDREEQDVYIAALLIAMAQNHFYRPTSMPKEPGSQEGIPPPKVTTVAHPQFREIKVQVIMHEEGTSNWPNFIVYSTVFTKEFLERLRYPEKACGVTSGFEYPEGIEIDYTNVPFFPLLGLKERLAKALGREVGGDPHYWDPEKIEFWDELVEEPQPVYRAVTPVHSRVAVNSSVSKRKRKVRPALSEVLNSSFEDDCPTNYPSSDDDDDLVLSPSAKKRRTAEPASTLGVC
ncbi:hypothetical protein QBC47DRAFT_2493 [Echria macrotheca]|uniref:Uncharacterized protein n=1 Tax=Echria macrotheca TaxID=438768 RepID=A0AAJ0FFS7_9PEZI|nr:hypothetical protein QBC47DRAFT_2493 [Echria macrotheca]